MRSLVILVLSVLCIAPVLAAEPDYSTWDRLLAKYYDPQRGMNYGALKAHDSATLKALRHDLGTTDLRGLGRDQQLAYWINLYNVNAVGIVVDHYPVKSIRDISTDPIRRLNVFERDLVPFAGEMISLDRIEHEQIRKRFRDPRIHFAINCAAKSCPPMPSRALRGADLNPVLEAQTRAFVNHFPIERKKNHTVIHVTRIMDWFADDFGDRIAFLRRYLTPANRSRLKGDVRVEFSDYDWSLNDWR